MHIQAAGPVALSPDIASIDFATNPEQTWATLNNVEFHRRLLDNCGVMLDAGFDGLDTIGNGSTVSHRHVLAGQVGLVVVSFDAKSRTRTDEITWHNSVASIGYQVRPIGPNAEHSVVAAALHNLTISKRDQVKLLPLKAFVMGKNYPQILGEGVGKYLEGLRDFAQSTDAKIAKQPTLARRTA